MGHIIFRKIVVGIVDVYTILVVHGALFFLEANIRLGWYLLMGGHLKIGAWLWIDSGVDSVIGQVPI